MSTEKRPEKVTELTDEEIAKVAGGIGTGVNPKPMPVVGGTPNPPGSSVGHPSSGPTSGPVAPGSPPGPIHG